MKAIQIKIFLLLSSSIFLMSSCTNYAKINKDLLAGYGQYENCLQSCDALEAKYTAEYNSCYKNCPVIINTAHCSHLATEEAREACLEEEFAKQLPCTICTQEYIDHLKEVEDCRKQCLIVYNNLHSIYIP